MMMGQKLFVRLEFLGQGLNWLLTARLYDKKGLQQIAGSLNR